MKRRFDLRNPPRWARRLAIAIFAIAPGALAGGMIALWMGHFAMCAVVGALVAAILGAACET